MYITSIFICKVLVNASTYEYTVSYPICLLMWLYCHSYLGMKGWMKGWKAEEGNSDTPLSSQLIIEIGFSNFWCSFLSKGRITNCFWSSEDNFLIPLQYQDVQYMIFDMHRGIEAPAIKFAINSDISTISWSMALMEINIARTC